MEAFSTANSSKLRGRPQSIAKASLGRRFEDLAVGYYRKHGFKILARNVRRGHAEIDFIAQKASILYVVEVRGRTGVGFMPSEVLPEKKRRRILGFARQLSQRKKRIVRVQLVQLVGDPRRFPPVLIPFVVLLPMALLGMEISIFDLE